MSTSASAKGIELAHVHEEGTPEGLCGDGVRVRQILANFLSNAVKFTEKGEIVVTVSATVIQGNDTG